VKEGFQVFHVSFEGRNKDHVNHFILIVLDDARHASLQMSKSMLYMNAKVHCSHMA
jgi:hypothetical protein